MEGEKKGMNPMMIWIAGFATQFIQLIFVIIPLSLNIFGLLVHLTMAGLYAGMKMGSQKQTYTFVTAILAILALIYGFIGTILNIIWYNVGLGLHVWCAWAEAVDLDREGDGTFSGRAMNFESQENCVSKTKSYYTAKTIFDFLCNVIFVGVVIMHW